MQSPDRFSAAARLSAEFAVIPNETLLTPDDLETLGIATRSTLAKWRADHVGPQHIVIGAGIRYRAVDVRTWIAAGGTRGSLHRHLASAA